ncbi:MAG: sigma-70 family RNA polymerase sigma factor [Planctomycetes bacterium]|nr:sigma-70 family RNA polymerase sigma factor [Planctomycetota bacterium]MCG2682068.1 sigma-70 family RNA polymerase sigma factor [Planctomycetales bacterium]
MPLDHDPSFVALFVKNQRRIYGYILTLVPDCNEADDLFQQTSMVLWEKAGEFRKKGTGPICAKHPSGRSGKLDLSPFSDREENFVRWGCGIAHNLIRNWRVKKRRDRHCFSDGMMARIAAVRSEKSEWLDGALAALGVCMDDLDPSERELLALCYESQRSIRQVSEELGRTEGAVYQHLHRIRAKLLECIERKTREKASP